MEIGQKLRNAREAHQFTQEKIAEELGCTRQTISNWENNRSYPDIISVIKLSDIYHISLDELLKGDEKLMTHLEESTNIVRSKNKQSKLIEVLSYLVVWAVGIIFFYEFLSPGDEMAYSLLFIYGILPITTLIISFFIGRDSGWSKIKWLMPFFFGVMLYLSGYLTFDLLNAVSNQKINWPDLESLLMFTLSGTTVSYIGLGIGALVQYLAGRKKKRNTP